MNMPSLAQKIELIDEALRRSAARPLAENRLFKLDLDLNFEDYVSYSVNAEGGVPLQLRISADALQVDVDDMAEVFEWSSQQIDVESEEVVGALMMLLRSTVKIKRCGPRYRMIFFYDAQENCVQTYKYISGFYWPFACTTTSYAPILSQCA